MTVFRRRDRGNAWWYEFERNRKRYCRPCLLPNGDRARTKKEAQDAESAAKATVSRRRTLADQGVDPGAYTLSQAVALYLKRKAGRTPEHIDNALLYTREIGRFFGPACAFDDLDEERIEEYRSHAAAQTLKVWLGGPRRKTPEDFDNARLWRDTGRPRSLRTVNNYLKCLIALLSIAETIRDPLTGAPVMVRRLDVKLHRIGKRKPRPISDAELNTRLAAAPPWTHEAGDLSRLFGLRLAEALKAELRHIDHGSKRLRFRAGETKSGNDEWVAGGKEGWALIERLERQAIARGQKRLVTWPGPKLWRAFLRGEKIPRKEWRPLASVKGSWQRTGVLVDDPHRFHDVRARAITEVARENKAAAKPFARHQDPSTTEGYIDVADEEVAAVVARAMARRPKPAKRPKLRAVA